MIGLIRREHLRSWDLWRASGPVRLEPVERFGIRVMSAGFLVGESQALAFPAPLVEAVLRQLLVNVAWGELEELIVDLPPGTADLQQHLLGLIRPTGAVIVVSPQDVAHLDARARPLSCSAGRRSPFWVGWRTSRPWPVRTAASRSRSSPRSPNPAPSGRRVSPCLAGSRSTRWSPPPATAAAHCLSITPPALRLRPCARSRPGSSPLWRKAPARSLHPIAQPGTGRIRPSDWPLARTPGHQHPYRELRHELRSAAAPVSDQSVGVRIGDGAGPVSANVQRQS
jgi:hypothetical protein